MSVTITRNGDRLYIKSPFHMKDTIKRITGRQWDVPKGCKAWTLPATPTAAGNARAVMTAAGVDLQVDLATLQLLAASEQQDAAHANKHRDDLPEFAGRVCDCPDGPTPGDWDEGTNPLMCQVCENPCASLMHQRQAVHFALPRDAAMLGMDMGTGKSKCAIGLLDEWDVDLAIILAPVKACRVWPREFHGGDVEGFHGHSLRPWQVVNGMGITGRSGRPLKKPSMKQRVAQAQECIERASRDRHPAAIVFNYEAAWQQPCKDFLLGIRDSAEHAYGRPLKIGLILDESHKIKAPNGKWSKFAETLARRCDKRLALTGTPNPHSEPDLYAQARAIDPGIFGSNFGQFKHKYFDMGGFEGREIMGWIDDQAEQDFVRQFASFAYICDSDDVLDLPEVTELPTYTCKLGDEAAKHYASIESDFMTTVLREAGAEQDGEPVIAQNALAQLLRLAQITSGHLPVGDKDLGTHEIVTIDDSKAKLLADVLDDLPADEPMVIFGRFHHDMKTIREVVEKSGRTYAEISGRKGQVDGLTADARMNPDVDVVGVQLQAGGVGIDLTRARYAIYYALDFNLGDFKQSRKRVHRPGQLRPVFFVFLACEGTVDEIIASSLRNRDAVLTALKNAAKTFHQDPVPA